MGFEPRDRVRAEARRLLTAGVTGRVFPGGMASVSWRDDRGREELVEACAGTLTTGGARVQENTPYDLAAVTQPFVAIAALRMVARGAIDLGAQVERFVSDVRGGVLTGVTLRQLLTHEGGLARWGGLYLDVPHELGSAAARRWMISEAARRAEEPPEADEPSDLGYMIAGEAIARAARTTLDEVLDREVLEPLGLRDQVFYPGALPSERRVALKRKAAPTERCDWRGRLVVGEPQDENATALGGVAGHAGLFATARGVAMFGRAVLDAVAGRSDYLPSDALADALQVVRPGGHLCLGWERKHGTPPACGRRMGPRTFGRLGFTGTSIFCDPDRDVVIVLLTNRVCPSRANEKIEGFRPAFHDGLMAALG